MTSDPKARGGATGLDDLVGPMSPTAWMDEPVPIRSVPYPKNATGLRALRWIWFRPDSGTPGGSLNSD